MLLIRGGIILVFICLFRWQLSAQDVMTLLERRITLQVSDATAEEILERVVDENNLFFSYNPDILPQDRQSIHHESIPLGDLLKEILPPPDYLIEIVDNQIIITRNEKTPLKLTGIVTDARERTPIPYASVSIAGESIGTMTNQDGRFDLIIPSRLKEKTIQVRCLGYLENRFTPSDTLTTVAIKLEPVSIRLREIEVRPVVPQEILRNFRRNIAENYEADPQLMITFYRETVTQDNRYLDVWEAVMEILKASYQSDADDRVRFLKGRKQNLNKSSHNINLKMQGGPWYINKLDVVKTMESFLSPEFEHLYEYKFDQPVILDNRVTWVIRFNRKEDVDFPCFHGKFLIDSESYALVSADFGFDKKSLKLNGETFIRQEPHGYETRPEQADYSVNYRYYNGKWQFFSARSDVVFQIRQKRIFKTEYRSTTDILVTQQYTYPRKARFGPDGMFRADDIFSDFIGPYDPDFWGNYNIIRPDEDLSNAIRNANPSSETPELTD